MFVWFSPVSISTVCRSFSLYTVSEAGNLASTSFMQMTKNKRTKANVNETTVTDESDQTCHQGPTSDASSTIELGVSLKSCSTVKTVSVSGYFYSLGHFSCSASPCSSISGKRCTQATPTTVCSDNLGTCYKTVNFTCQMKSVKHLEVQWRQLGSGLAVLLKLCEVRIYGKAAVQ